MHWNADAFFAKGKTHMVCQDYAKAATTEGGHAYALVCDGCSSSEHTDVGARLLAHSAALNMEWLRTPDPSFSDREHLIIQAAANAATEIGAPLRCLDATLVAARTGLDENGNAGVRVSMRGDGVVVTRGRDGYWGFDVVEHDHNAPRYLNYDINDDRLQGYLARFGERGSWRPWSSTNGWIPAGPVFFEGHPKDWFYDARYFDLVMVMSDGVQTFQRAVRTGTTKTFEDVPLEQVIEHLLKIKNPTGAFLQRRCHKFLTKYCALNEWQHGDDFSAAAIWMGELDGEQ